jgi:hypothetical protein
MKIMRRCALLPLLFASIWSVRATAQAPAEFLRKLSPSRETKVVKIEYVNPFDNSHGTALLEVPRAMK